MPVFFEDVKRGADTQLVFENYRLRWIDGYTGGQAESGKSFYSSNSADFSFDPDSSKHESVNCLTAACIKQTLRSAIVDQKYKINVPRRALLSFFRSEVIRNPQMQMLSN